MINFAEDNDFEKKHGPLRSNIRDTEQISSNKQEGTESSGVTQNSQAPKMKATSEKKIAANRRNAQRSTGPGDTERTRHNATKHGLCSQGLTPLDDLEQYNELVCDLTYMHPPQNRVHENWIHHAALEMIKVSRSDAIEAYNINLVCMSVESPSDQTSDQPAKVLDFRMIDEYIGPTMDRMQRHSTAALNKLRFYLRLLEPLRRKESDQDNFEIKQDGTVTVLV